MKSPADRTIAYFSMEIAVDPNVPTYSGGLGVLAGDTVRAAADMRLPMVAVTLLHRKGYFFQHLDEAGRQTEDEVAWVVDDFAKELPARAVVHVEGRAVTVRAWSRTVSGVSGYEAPVVFLDTDLPENATFDRTLTDTLYGGDDRYRLCQEIVLGIGGVRILRALGYTNLARFHMNEGHAALLTLELLNEVRDGETTTRITKEQAEAVRRQCVFTTHTPVAAGHDKFPIEMAARVTGYTEEFFEQNGYFRHEDTLNLTYLGLNFSRYVNGVAKRHGEVSRAMFQGFTIDSITNGVHAGTWTSPEFQAIFDTCSPGWREDNFSLRNVLGVSDEVIWDAHMSAKKKLIHMMNHETNAGFDVDHLTLGFARRAAPYKRSALPLCDPERLAAIVDRVGPIQFAYAGKAHPADEVGKGMIQRIFQARAALRGKVAVAYLPNYDMEIAEYFTTGVDVWLNTPQPPLEASGTSGMKAALNGVPSLSVVDGWWVEGWMEGVTGWAIGEHDHTDADGDDTWDRDAESLYDTLEHQVAPLYYNDRGKFIDIMRHCIAVNGSFFNAQRMLQEYMLRAYAR